MGRSRQRFREGLGFMGRTRQRSMRRAGIYGKDQAKVYEKGWGLWKGLGLWESPGKSLKKGWGYGKVQAKN